MSQTNLKSVKHRLTCEGEPVLLLGDTVWTIAVRFTDRQIDRYLADAVRRKFNLIAVFGTPTWALRPKRAPTGKNRFGASPFRGAGSGNPWMLNRDYWERYRVLTRKAAQRGIYVMLMTGTPLANSSPFNPLDTQTKVYRYGHALGVFFRGVNRSLIWMLGQDSPAGKPDHPSGMPDWKIDACARGIADGVNGVYKPRGRSADYGEILMSFHCQGGQVTSDHYHRKPWLDFNTFQTQWGGPGSPSGYALTVPLAARAHTRRPQKPVFCVEPCYEGHVHRDKEKKTDWHVRMEAYWSLLSGSCGHVYGADGVWNAGVPTKILKHRVKTTLDAGLKARGRLDMQWVRKLFESKPLEGRIPDPALILSDRHETDMTRKEYICAARDRKGTYAFVYSTKGLGFKADLAKLAGIPGLVRARWFDPRTGRYSAAKRCKKSARRFVPPSRGPGCDWVLVLDAHEPE